MWRDLWPAGLAVVCFGVAGASPTISREAFYAVHVFCELGIVVAFWTAVIFTVRLWPRKGKRAVSLAFVVNGLMSLVLVAAVGWSFSMLAAGR